MGFYNSIVCVYCQVVNILSFFFCHDVLIIATCHESSWNLVTSMQRILGRIPVYGVIQAALDTCLCVHAFFGSKINKILKKFFFLLFTLFYVLLP